MISLFGIRDMIREEVPDAITTVKRAGVKVIMCTGDNILTAKQIAKETGILNVDSHSFKSEYACMEGKDFREAVGGLYEHNGKEVVRNMKKFREISRDLRVLARSTPQDKYLLVTALQNIGEVVSVTGDGTNDAPALTKAQVGFSMGIQGTTVAKEASDIILLDDNFRCIIIALMYGRNVFDNVRKFLQF